MAEDRCTGDAEDEHQQALAEEPLAHADLGAVEGDGETEAVIHGDQRHEPAIGVFALEHEVDAEDEGGEDIEDARQPVGERGEQVFGGGGDGVFGLLGDGADAEVVGEREALEAGFDDRDAVGQIVGELVEIADHGRKAEGEECCDGKEGDREQKRDGRSAGDMVSAADLEAHDGADGRHEDDREERADVDQQEDFAQTPCQRQGNQDAEDKENVAADSAAGVFLSWRREGQGVLLKVEMLYSNCNARLHSATGF